MRKIILILFIFVMTVYAEEKKLPEQASDKAKERKSRIEELKERIKIELVKEFKNEEFFLHISQYQPKKNVDRIIEAYKKLSNPKPKFILIVSGYQKTVNDDNIILIKKAKETIELVGLYQKALVFVFPSLHEAFGMPILEAMACGCPVITSNITGCAEIAGDAALLVNPYSVDEISNAMRKIMESPELREDLSKKGLERVKQFTWEKSAKEHLKVFEMVLKE